MSYRLVQLPLISMAFLSLLVLAVLLAAPALADSPFDKDAIELDWVCVTDAALVDAYAPLAAHRQSQGLASIVLPLDEVIRWSPAGDDTIATLRWLSGVAVNQWGAQYLLLGGSHALLPSPIHRLVTPNYDFDHPIDTYFSCLDGQWDVDGDGLFAETEDAAEPTIHIALGRIPADDVISVNNIVSKILAFEQRPLETTRGALFVSSLMDPYWEPSDPYPNAILGYAMSLQDRVMTMAPEMRVGSLYQGNEDVPPLADPLNRQALVDSLGGRAHDLVFVQLNGIARAWELVYHLTVESHHFEALAGSGHSFILTMVSGPVADTRSECLVQNLLCMPDGGAVATVTPTGMGYIFPMHFLHDELWSQLVGQSAHRIGDAFVAAMAVFQDEMVFHSGNASTYWYQAVMGDPATLLQTTQGPVAVGPPPATASPVRAIPNPFNPQTTIHFEVPGNPNQSQPVLVEVYNLQGRRVATLLNERLLPGPQSVIWDGGNISGLYFARVTVAGQTQSTKLTLVE